VHFRVYPIIFVPLLVMHEYHSAKENKAKAAVKFAVEFGVVAGGVFLALAAYFYSLYGFQFIEESYRHSKSVYFY
jgi:hypothetical protein